MSTSPPTAIILALVGATACADLVGADFDVRTRVDDVGSGAAGGGGTGGSGGGGGSGGASSGLVVEDLIARYFMDEQSGGLPTTLQDSGPDGLDLDVFAGDNMDFVETAGNRGVMWQTLESLGVATRTGVADGLAGRDRATIEAVVDLQGGQTSPRLFHVGETGVAQGFLAIALNHLGNWQLRIRNAEAGVWTASVLGRRVVHARIDLRVEAPGPPELLVDGAVQSVLINNPGGTFDVPPGSTFSLGNRPDVDRSPMGTIYYFALYARWLSDEEIAQNTSILIANDDTP